MKYTDKHKISQRNFYLCDPVELAQKCIGKLFVRRTGTVDYSGLIVETEAYRGADDPSAHSYRGCTKRNDVMFRKGGCLYVYFTYGMHFCCNISAGPQGLGDAVLIRALEPVSGIEQMMMNRRSGSGRNMSLKNLCSGPAKLCSAMKIDMKDNGSDLCGDEIFLSGSGSQKIQIDKSPRIGISRAKDRLWRFTLHGSQFLSR